MHCIATVVLKKKFNLTSVVIRSKKSPWFGMTTQVFSIRLKLLRRQCTEHLWISFSLFCAKYDAFLCYWGAWFEASVEYSKYVIDEMCRRCNFSWTACWIRLWLFWTFILPGATVIFGVFFGVLDQKSELSFSFDGASSEIGRKIKHLQAKQRTCQNAQGLRH